MLLIIPYLVALGIFFDGFGHTVDALSNAGFFQWLGSIEWSAMHNWFRSAPVPAPQLSFGNDGLYSQFQQFMDMQFQIGELKRHVLTMPALSGEGY